MVHPNKYRPDIDGLRAIAVLPVIFFHARVAGFSGGFVGVDIFYVISGYLITSVIAQDIALERFSIVSFYERRIRRIFPALFGVMGFCTVAACILFSPKDLVVFGKSMIAATSFVSNIFFKRQAGAYGYFDASSDLQVLLHTWSLSVEEQFYLLFPTTLLLLWRWARKRLITSLSIIAFGSFLICVWTTQHRPLTAFYIFVPRAWELLIGSLLALKAVPLLQRRALREIAGLVGLGCIVAAVCTLSRDTPFPGLAALLPCLGAWLIIYSGEGGPSTIRTILSVRPLVFIGLISYSLYLWHWPMLVFSRYFAAGDLTGLETAVVIGLALLAAVISFECIEKPFRGKSTVNSRQIFALGGAATALSLVMGLAIWCQHGFPGRYASQTRTLIAENTERKNDFLEECGNWRKEIHTINDISFCRMEPAKSRPNSFKLIMFWGDSHVQQLYPLIKKMHDAGELQGRGVLLTASNGCTPAEHFNRIQKGFHCDAFAKFALMRAEQDDVDAVFLAFNTWWATHLDICPSVDGTCVGKPSLEETRQLFVDELSDDIHSLRSLGKRVIVSLPFPMFDKSIPDLEIRNAVFDRFGLGGIAKDITSPAFRDQVAWVARSAGAEIFDPRESLCHDGGCITQVNGVSIYKDDSHIAASQIGILEDELRETLLVEHKGQVIGRKYSEHSPLEARTPRVSKEGLGRRPSIDKPRALSRFASVG